MAVCEQSMTLFNMNKGIGKLRVQYNPGNGNGKQSEFNIMPGIRVQYIVDKMEKTTTTKK